MFDIGFWELVICGVVALIVLGPERLPVVASKVGNWIGRMRRFVSEAKQDIDREIRLQEIKKAIEREASLDEIRNIIDTGKHVIEDEIKQTEYAVKAMPDEQHVHPPAPAITQDDNSQYGHTEHKINPLDLLETPMENGLPVPPVTSAPAASSTPAADTDKNSDSKHDRSTNG